MVTPMNLMLTIIQIQLVVSFGMHTKQSIHNASIKITDTDRLSIYFYCVYL